MAPQANENRIPSDLTANVVGQRNPASIYFHNLEYEKRQNGVISALAFSPDGSILASATWNNAISLLDVGTGWETRILARGVKNPYSDAHGVVSLSFSPDGKTLASAGDIFNDLLAGGEVRLWGVGSGRLLRSISVYKVPWIRSLYARSSESGKTVMAVIAAFFQALWPAFALDYVLDMQHPPEYMFDTRTTAAVFLANGKTVLATYRMGFGSSHSKGEIKAWDLQTGELKGEWPRGESVLSGA